MRMLSAFIRGHDRQVLKVLRLIPRTPKPFSYREAELRLKELQIMGFALWIGFVAVLSYQYMHGGLQKFLRPPLAAASGEPMSPEHEKSGHRDLTCFWSPTLG